VLGTRSCGLTGPCAHPRSDVHVDTVTAVKIRELARQKDEAVAREDYDTAKGLKAGRGTMQHLVAARAWRVGCRGSLQAPRGSLRPRRDHCHPLACTASTSAQVPKRHPTKALGRSFRRSG
jgi:hypothetical protein